jgi:hypothetical protein
MGSLLAKVLTRTSMVEVTTRVGPLMTKVLMRRSIVVGWTSSSVTKMYALVQAAVAVQMQEKPEKQPQRRGGRSRRPFLPMLKFTIHTTHDQGGKSVQGQ